MNKRYIEYEERRAKGVQIARDASAVFRKAGIAKAGRYSPYGREQHGYIATETGNGTHDNPRAVCMWAGKDSDEAIAQMRQAIEADGRFAIVGSHASGSFNIERRGKTPATCGVEHPRATYMHCAKPEGHHGTHSFA